MDKKITGLLGTAAALAIGSAGADAMPTQPSVMNVTSYADLLEPIQNASEVLVADDAARAVQIPGLELVQYYGYHHHHHHHHGFFGFRPYYHHHHHHNAYYYRRYYRPYYHHHHHHHHHHNAYGYRYYRGY